KVTAVIASIWCLYCRKNNSQQELSWVPSVYLENVTCEDLGGLTQFDVGSKQNWAQSGCDVEAEPEEGIGEPNRDNDQHGRGNNAVYYSYLDTIINPYPMRYCGLKTGLLMSPMVGFIVTNQCTSHSPVGFPQIAVAVLVMEKVGHSSEHYRLALFPPKPTKEPPSVDLRHLSDGFFFGHPKPAQFAALACTTGSSVHVFVNPVISKPVGLPEDFRRGFLWLMSPAPV
ncbi:hypothetical protein DBR06_SOUSAS9010021, partial [Sousa chinensis]